MTSFAQWLKGKDLGLFNQFPRYFVQTSCIEIALLALLFVLRENGAIQIVFFIFRDFCHSECPSA